MAGEVARRLAGWVAAGVDAVDGVDVDVVDVVTRAVTGVLLCKVDKITLGTWK